MKRIGTARVVEKRRVRERPLQKLTEGAARRAREKQDGSIETPQTNDQERQAIATRQRQGCAAPSPGVVDPSAIFRWS